MFSYLILAVMLSLAQASVVVRTTFYSLRLQLAVCRLAPNVISTLFECHPTGYVGQSYYRSLEMNMDKKFWNTGQHISKLLSCRTQDLF